MSRGYCGIGIHRGKIAFNYGTLLRSAHIYSADFFFMVGARFKPQCSDTMKAWRHMPVYSYEDFDMLLDHLPYSCKLVGVEVGGRPIANYVHPERACYLLGAEDVGLSGGMLDKCHEIIGLPGERSVNVAVAGSLVLFHRHLQNFS